MVWPGQDPPPLAIEYAYRFKDDYDVGWWLRAEDPALLAGDCTALARALDLPEKDAREQAIVIAAVRRWLLVYDDAEHPRVVRDALRGRRPGTSSSLRGIRRGQASPRCCRSIGGRGRSRSGSCASGGGSGRARRGPARAALGDLPLALEQAAAYCEQT